MLYANVVEKNKKNRQSQQKGNSRSHKKWTKFGSSCVNQVVQLF